jgi:hypothetical protein
MSQIEDRFGGPVAEGDEFPEYEEPKTPSSSLDGRMKARTEELESRTSEFFQVPGFEDIIAVELRLLGFEAQRKIARRNERIRDTTVQELYTACDCILRATEGLYEVDGDTRTPIRDTWIDLARRAGKTLPNDVTDRQALLALVGSFRVVGLWQEWSQWVSGRRPEVEEEVMRDFEVTG